MVGEGGGGVMNTPCIHYGLVREQWADGHGGIVAAQSQSGWGNRESTAHSPSTNSTASQAVATESTAHSTSTNSTASQAVATERVLHTAHQQTVQPVRL